MTKERTPKKTKDGKKLPNTPSSMDWATFMPPDEVFDFRTVEEKASELRNGATLN